MLGANLDFHWGGEEVAQAAQAIESQHLIRIEPFMEMRPDNVLNSLPQQVIEKLTAPRQ